MSTAVRRDTASKFKYKMYGGEDEMTSVKKLIDVDKSFSSNDNSHFDPCVELCCCKWTRQTAHKDSLISYLYGAETAAHHGCANSVLV